MIRGWKILQRTESFSTLHVNSDRMLAVFDYSTRQATEKTTVGMVFIPLHFHEVAANLLTNDALDPRAKIPEFKACAVQVFPATESDLPNAEIVLNRGRY